MTNNSFSNSLSIIKIILYTTNHPSLKNAVNSMVVFESGIDEVNKLISQSEENVSIYT